MLRRGSLAISIRKSVTYIFPLKILMKKTLPFTKIHKKNDVQIFLLSRFMAHLWEIMCVFIQYIEMQLNWLNLKISHNIMTHVGMHSYLSVNG